jgi:uncharacterized protein YkwD
VLVLAGCASRSQPAPESATISVDPVAPSGPPARWYMSPAPRAPIDGDPSRRLVADEIGRMAGAAGLTPPMRDGRLDGVADDLARHTSHEHQPSFELVSFLLSHYGIVEPEPNLLFARGGPRAERDIAELVRPQVTAILREARRTRLGVGVHRSDSELAVVFAFQAQNLELKPLPRALDPGLVAHVEGRLLEGFRIPKVIVTATDGTVTDLRVKGTADRFEADLGCRRDRPGAFQLEIAADSDRGPAVLGNFPIYCGVEPPARSPPLVIDTSGSAEPEEVEAEILALVNRDRTKQGLWPVRMDRRLSEVARAYSQEMAATGMVAHVSPRTGNSADRLNRARVSVRLVGENVGRAYSASDAHRGFMASPGHRSNVVDPRMTAVGIGVVRGQPESRAIPLFITEIFVAGLN